MRRPAVAWLTIVLALFAGASGAAAQSGALAVGVGTPMNGWRADVRVDGVLEDAAFQEALESGLPLRFRFRVELWEKALFDRLRGAQETDFALIRDPLEGSYHLTHGRSNTTLSSLADAERILQSNASRELRPERRGRFYYLVTLEVETLSLTDLEELQRWIRGEAGPAVQGRTPVGRAVGRGIQRAFVRMIGLPTRRYDARSATFVVE